MVAQATLAQNIVESLDRLQGVEPSQIMKGDDFKLPRLIPAGPDGSFQISKAIDEDIGTLAAVLKSARPALAKTVRDEEWRTWVRNEVGPSVVGIDPATPTTEAGAAMLRALELRLDQIVAGLNSREHAFGATLFGNADIPRFDFGPVTIEPIDGWLTRKEAEGFVSSVTARRVRSALAGKKQVKRKSSVEAFQENDILKVTRNSPYVVSVKLGGYGSAAGLETAAEAARLALVTVALVWTRPTDAMRGFRMNFDGPVYNRMALTFVPGRTILAGSSLQGHPAGPRIEAKAWAKVQTDYVAIFDAAGEAIQHRVNPDSTSPRASIMNALAQALFWFHAGCVQSSDSSAVVNFSACLDALSGGHKAKGILGLTETRLGVKGSDPINPGGPTFKAVVDRIYNDGRSRTVHGTSAKVGHDWTETRGLAEQLARVTLLACLDRAGGNSNLTDADALWTR